MVAKEDREDGILSPFGRATQGEAGADSPLEDRVETETLETYIIKLFFCRHSSCNVPEADTNEICRT